MAVATDILLSDDWDLEISSGDFLTGASDLQHLALITEMAIGHLKENPFLGINIRSYLGGSTPATEIKANAQQMYEADNYVVQNISVSNGEIISVSAERK